MTDELNNPPEPIVINGRVSELDKRVKEYELDHNLGVGMIVYPSDGTIHITQEWAGGVQGAIIGFDGPKPDGGQIRLTPYLNDVARALPAALEDLRRLRNAIEGAAAEHRQGLTATTETAVTLNYIEQKIKDAYDRIVSERELYPTDDAIAARLPIGRKGQPITRETVNRYRRKMRRRDIKV